MMFRSRIWLKKREDDIIELDETSLPFKEEEFNVKDLCAVEKWVWNTWKPISARTDQSNRTITFGVDTAACRTVVPGNHPAARGYRVHWDSGAGVLYSTAGKSVVWDEWVDVCWWQSRRQENRL